MMRKMMLALRMAPAAGLLLAAQTGGAIAADCAAAAAAVVRSTGGELLSAVPTKDGSSCQVTVIIPANNGNMPRKITRTVPAS